MKSPNNPNTFQSNYSTSPLFQSLQEPTSLIHYKNLTQLQKSTLLLHLSIVISTMISKQSNRKSRSKLRKPKFKSLRLHLTPPPMPTTEHYDQKQLINLFPLHPENLMEQDKLDMSCIFSSCDDDGAATTLTGILCPNDEEEDVNTNNPSPSSVNYAEEEVEFVRTAMRRNKMDKNDHEKFVCYLEVVDRNKVIRGMSSSSSSTTSCYHHYNHNDQDHHRSKLVLKLDYEKIMKSWVNKGPLYITNNSDPDAPQPQTVPDLQDDDFFFPFSIDGTTYNERDNGGNQGAWTVPQMTDTENNGIGGGDDALLAGEPREMIHNREASVQRYKEKRRNRLFSKTIRYEVRKLNAEKRPRIKGRFVKRSREN